MKMTFENYFEKIKSFCGDFQLPKRFEDRMKEYYDKGYTPEQAIGAFCENSNKEFEKEILNRSKHDTRNARTKTTS